MYEDPEEVGSVIDLCHDVLRNAEAITRSLQQDNGTSCSADSGLALLPFYAEHAVGILHQCQQEFGKDTSATIEKARALQGRPRSMLCLCMWQ